MTKNLKLLNIKPPKELGKVVYISDFKPNYLKTYHLPLKAFYLLFAIGLAIFLDYHLKYNDNSMDFDTYYLILVLGVYFIYLFISEFFRFESIKIIGERGFIIYGYRFTLKQPKITQILFKDLSRIEQRDFPKRWIIGEEAYHTYRFFDKENKKVLELKFYKADRENLAFIDTIYKQIQNKPNN